MSICNNVFFISLKVVNNSGIKWEEVVKIEYIYPAVLAPFL